MSDLAGRARGATVWALAGLLVLFLGVPVGALVVRALGAGESWDARTYETLRQALGLSVATTAVTMVVVIAWGRRWPTFWRGTDSRGPRSSRLWSICRSCCRRRWQGSHSWWHLDATALLGHGSPTAVSRSGSPRRQSYGSALRLGSVLRDRRESRFSHESIKTSKPRRQTSGAPPGRVLRTVTLPLIAPSLIAGAVLAWARALGEFGAHDHVRREFPGVTQTMPLAIYGRFGAGDLPTALLLSVVLLVASLTVLLGVRIVGTRVREGSERRQRSRYDRAPSLISRGDTLCG
jgi:hypothetical protein